MPRLPQQGFPGVFRKFIGKEVQLVRTVVTKHKLDVPLLVPAIQVRCLREVGITPQQDPAEAGTAAELKALVELLGRAPVTGAFRCRSSSIDATAGR
jgi:hypothetical protein